jgi:hypothetical protein
LSSWNRFPFTAKSLKAGTPLGPPQRRRGGRWLAAGRAHLKRTHLVY